MESLYCLVWKYTCLKSDGWLLLSSRGRDTRHRVPPHRLPYVRNYRIRLLPRVFGVKANTGVWVDKAWARQPPTLQPVEPLPCPAALGFVTAPTNDPEPQSAYLGIEFAGRFHVAGHRMVIREPTNHTCQPCSCVLQRIMHPFDQLRFYLF